MGKSESTPRDEAWIAKYRAALDQTPVSRSRVEKLREVAKRCSMVAAKFLAKIMGWFSGNRQATMPNTSRRKRSGSTPVQAAGRTSATLQNRQKKASRRKVG
jgi:hypothetical protein